MASLFSLSFLQNTRPFLFPNPNPSLRLSAPRPRTFRRCLRANGKRESPSPPPLTVEKRSLAVATGELFLGLASVLLRIRSSSAGGAVVESEEKEEAGYSGSRRRVASVVEEPVIWEQRPEDLVAEREMKKVTSPGFSFSAAGLLFPYHLGVARLLLDNGYIKLFSSVSGYHRHAVKSFPLLSSPLAVVPVLLKLFHCCAAFPLLLLLFHATLQFLAYAAAVLFAIPATFPQMVRSQEDGFPLVIATSKFICV